jgi:hypothetical protein
MPRKSPGGMRQGAPGKAYSNRKDLNPTAKQPIRSAPNQQYGARTAQEEAQKVIPLPETPQPGSFGQLTRPTERPNEPVTAGIPAGPGPNRINNADQLMPMDKDPLVIAQSLYRASPSPEIARLVRFMEAKADGKTL